MMMNDGDIDDILTETLAETENYSIWTASEPDGETTFHIELGRVTLNFFEEEWTEFRASIHGIIAEIGDLDADAEDADVDLDWVILFFDREEWVEFRELMEQIKEE